MISRSQLALQSEIEELRRILAGIPEDAVIDRFAFEQRLKLATDELEAAKVPGSFPESLRLTFRGAPVVGSRGIYAEFAGKASNAFSDAFSAILAGLNSTLKYMGPIPDKIKHPLLITGTAVGSFGFEIELPVEDDLFAGYSGADEAIEKFRDLLRVAAEGTDDEMAEIVEEIHPRAVRKVAEFLGVLHSNNAWCGLEFRDEYFKYTDLDQLTAAEERLREENIIEKEETYFGEFQGVLPQSRSFEFLVEEDGSILKGKVDKDLEDPDILNRDWLHKPLKVTFDVVQVGQGRPRYSLSSFENLEHETRD